MATPAAGAAAGGSTVASHGGAAAAAGHPINGRAAHAAHKEAHGGCSGHSKVCRIKQQSCGFSVTGYDGHKIWRQVHSAVDNIPCTTCREHGQSIMRFVHDFVNVGLGKKAKYPGNFHKVAAQVRCAEMQCTREGRC
eukprot:TRINITY_DN2567_c0_g1_i1.p2 TRINITY_DN2567_c0_g1~~TRINITY_DN2567_c0_g1_i1.p2  ORF type:complete len:137 (+),score=36.97 TRINITY_DN2567_c0_g1_i1:139-549(+)